MSGTLLYEYDGGAVGKQDFAAAFKTLGVRAGDTMFVHAGLRSFGKLAKGVDRTTLCRTLIDACKESVGEKGTLAMPTFTYAYCREGVYDIDHSPSEVGSLTEFFRTEPGVIRSDHPIFSIAAWGPGARSLIAVGSDAFGTGSFLEHLHQRNALLVFLGATFKDSCTFVHYIEQKYKVPYRFVKHFPGICLHGGQKTPVDATYFVRPLDGSIDIDLARATEYLFFRGKLHRVPVGAGGVEAIRAIDLYEEGMRMLAEDPYFFAVRHTLSV